MKEIRFTTTLSDETVLEVSGHYSPGTPDGWYEQGDPDEFEPDQLWDTLTSLEMPWESLTQSDQESIISRGLEVGFESLPDDEEDWR